MTAAAVTAFILDVVMMAAMDIGIIVQISGQKRLNRCIRLAFGAAIETDARIGQCNPRAAANSAADQGIHALLHQKARQYAVPTAVGIHDLCTDNLAFRDLIELKLRGVTKVLENLSPP